MSLELWKEIFDWAAVLLVGLTFVAGAGALVTGKILSDRQALQLQDFSKQLDADKLGLSQQQQRAAEAETKLAGLETAASDARAEMARQQSRAATAEQSLLELQQKLNWRKISPQQRSKFIAAATAKPKGLVKIIALNGDSEAKDFAEKMKTLLKEAGWDSGPVTTGVFIEAPSVGLSVIIVSKDPPTIVSKESHQVSIPDNSPVVYGVFLQKALTEAGFTLSEAGIVESAGQENSVTLIVGSQP